MEINIRNLKITFDTPDGKGTLEAPQGTLSVPTPGNPGGNPGGGESDDSKPIAPGESIQAAVDANPEGTKFKLRSGVHKQQQVVPKSGNVFEGEAGTILDGENVATQAFRTGNPPYPANVQIRNLEIRNYATPDQRAVVEAGLYSTLDASEGWIIENNEIHHNGCIGIRIGNHAIVRGNNTHHNACLNMGGSGDGALVENNKIDFGNFEYKYIPGDQAGGTKFCLGTGLVVRNNTFYKNGGPSLWFDENVIDFTAEGNTIDEGDTEGIVVEICYRGKIKGNTVTRCGFRDKKTRYDWLWNSGIAIHSSPDCEVFDNQVSDCWSGIAAHQQDRHSNEPNPPVHGPHVISNLWVHNNHVDQKAEPTGSEVAIAAGLADDVGNMETFNSRNNRFTDNTYTLGPAKQPFAWANSTCTEAKWHEYGQQ